jgi:hypothetical protein
LISFPSTLRMEPSFRSSQIRVFMPTPAYTMPSSLLRHGTCLLFPSLSHLSSRSRFRMSILACPKGNELTKQETTLCPPTRYFPSYDPPLARSGILQPPPRLQSAKYNPHIIIRYRPRFSIDNMAWRDIPRFRGIYSQDLLHGRTRR